MAPCLKRPRAAYKAKNVPVGNSATVRGAAERRNPIMSMYVRYYLDEVGKMGLQLFYKGIFTGYVGIPERGA